MKRFDFRLAQVRDFRRQQLHLEELKLQSLAVERQALESESARLESETVATRRSLMVTGAALSEDLVRLDAHLRHLAASRKCQVTRLAEWETRAAGQRQALVEARRRVRLLEQMEEKQRREWQAQADREQENFAAELFLARPIRGD